MTSRSSFVAFVLLGCYVSLSFNMRLSHIQKRETVCETDTCKEAAHTLLDSIDKSQDPCQDFYAYACNNYIANHPLPDDKSSFGSFLALDDQAKEKLKQLLETPNPDDIPEIKNAKEMYAHCMKKEDNVEILKKELNKLGGWPILSSNDKTNSSSEISLESLLAKTSKKGSSTIVAPDVNVDMKNASAHIISVDQGKLPLGRENILDKIKYKELMEAYKKFILTSVTILRTDQEHSQEIEKEVELMIDFETKLANLTSKPENRRNYTELYNKLTLGDLQKETDPTGKIFDWKVYLNELLGLKLESSETIAAAELAYLKNVLQLIQETNKKAARFVKGRYAYTDSVSSTLQEIKWESLAVRRNKQSPALFGHLLADDNIDLLNDLLNINPRKGRHGHSKTLKE